VHGVGRNFFLLSIRNIFSMALLIPVQLRIRDLFFSALSEELSFCGADMFFSPLKKSTSRLAGFPLAAA